MDTHVCETTGHGIGTRYETGVFGFFSSHHVGRWAFSSLSSVRLCRFLRYSFIFSFLSSFLHVVASVSLVHPPSRIRLSCDLGWICGRSVTIDV